MTKEEILEKYGIEPIMMEMWVWDEVVEMAEFRLVICKNSDMEHPYLTIDKKLNEDFFKNASDTNPNKVQEPQVGDKGYFWDYEKYNQYVYSELRFIEPDHEWPYLCNFMPYAYFRNFSTEKQPWMQ